MLTIANDIEVAGEANTNGRAVAAVSEAKSDVVLLDLEMPGGGAEETVGGYSGSRSRRRSSSPCTTSRA
jgi:DNA-binding NarL/FixJ family response regulator